MKLIGIDPGKSGAIAVLSADSTILSLHDMPLNKAGEVSIVGLRDIMLTFSKGDRACIEVCHGMKFDGKTQSTSSMLNYGMHVGMLQGMLFMQDVMYKEVQSTSWMSAFGVRGKTSGNYNGFKKCAELFSGVDLGKKNGRADALMIAEYLRRLLVEPENRNVA